MLASRDGAWVKKQTLKRETAMMSSADRKRVEHGAKSAQLAERAKSKIKKSPPERRLGNSRD